MKFQAHYMKKAKNDGRKMKEKERRKGGKEEREEEGKREGR